VGGWLGAWLRVVRPVVGRRLSAGCHRSRRVGEAEGACETIVDEAVGVLAVGVVEV